MRIMITGGGTGGHTSPAVAVIEELLKRDPRLVVQWVGRRGGIEERVCEKLSLPFRAVPVEGWPRKSGLKKPWVACKLAFAFWCAWVHLKRFNPQLVFGVGGYVSLPVMWVAQRMGIPTALHEQNRLLGMANRVLAPRACRAFLSFRDTIGQYPHDRAMVVGNPVRVGFAHPPDQSAARKALGLDDLPTVLVCGGSQGAHRLNQAVTEALPKFLPGEAQFLWMTGQADVAAARTLAASAPVRADVFPFIDDMVTACAAADVIVTRSGASTTAEIALLGKPSVLVPYPHATDNHQEQNARAFADAGAALLLHDDACTGARLLDLLRELFSAPPRLRAMGDAAKSLASPGAAERIVEELLTLVFAESAPASTAPRPPQDPAP